MNDRPRNRAYLAGPMTGYPDYNYPAFHRAAAKYRALGYDVVSPAEIHGNDFGKTFGEYMAADIAALATCGTIILLPWWQCSRGAKLELAYALANGLAVEVAAWEQKRGKAAKGVWIVTRVSSDAVHVGTIDGVVCYICERVGSIKERIKVAKAICKEHNSFIRKPTA